ncbi:related to RMT2 - protein-arginine N-methyltransferase [Melanopsichium pennsylvanicum]|uniref:Arginine N-methyltransferase 2 n=2 Tax=Melanopsichium pennsylvanicum TaxID=63383 RepID=A0AAJ4XJE6_9BASI|nr:related to RMT2-protein-arginine N-methyltransferase [Melanopsichium pennsylvanicum 4]SNX82796.1 related to RMT2 - protein-arginine N-methyltransferase [Melanopsichium pennsylvanicum]
MAVPSSSTKAAEEVTDILPPSRVARNLELHLAAESGDIATITSLLNYPASFFSSSTINNNNDDDDDRGGVDVWYEDPSSANWSALHFAAEQGHTQVVKLLLQNGAIWNAVDANGFTAAQVAHSMNHEYCYRAIFEEGVRQTFLLNALQGQLDSAQEDEDDDNDVETEAQVGPSDRKRPKTNSTSTHGTVQHTADGHITLKPSADDIANDTNTYLTTPLRFIPDPLGQVRCLDKDNNMVMAPWETDIMTLSASLLCSNQPSNFSILNVGFGLGIIDSIIQQNYQPGRHVIIEAHPDAIAYAKKLGFDKMQGVEIFEGRWEDWIKDSDHEEDVGKKAELGTFDAVYWDTYSQDYNDIKSFFDCLPNILNGSQSRFSFFHGLGATNQFYYDVYTRISELDLREIGFTTQWHTMIPKIKEEEWQGVKQRYWQLDRYYCPLAQLDIWE